MIMGVIAPMLQPGLAQATNLGSAVRAIQGRVLRHTGDTPTQAISAPLSVTCSRSGEGESVPLNQDQRRRFGSFPGSQKVPFVCRIDFYVTKAPLTRCNARRPGRRAW